MTRNGIVFSLFVLIPLRGHLIHGFLLQHATGKANGYFRRPWSTTNRQTRPSSRDYLALTRRHAVSNILDDSQLLTDLVVAGTLGFAVDPFVQIIFNATDARINASSNHDKVEFQSTFLYAAADSIEVAARTYGVLVIANAVSIRTGLLQSVFYQEETATSLRDSAPAVALTVWAAMTVSAAKRFIFQNAVSGERLGRVELYDKLIDAILLFISLSVILDELSIDLGTGLQSVLAGGGLGALIFSFASKELATNIIAGFAVQTWGAFSIGDVVRLGDGTEGTVVVIGLMETQILGYDNIIVRVPNGQLYNQRLSNLSQVKKSQFLQTLRFKYSDIQNLPSILQDIKAEIKASCPDLIVDDSKPFRVVLAKYEQDHIQADVLCHFNAPPGSNEFVHNREQVLLAIARAMEKNIAEFALPSIYYKTSNGGPGPE